MTTPYVCSVFQNPLSLALITTQSPRERGILRVRRNRDRGFRQKEIKA